MFEKSLNDLVRGIRAHKSNEASSQFRFVCAPRESSLSLSHQAVFIGQCMVEIKKELKQENMGLKCNAIAKLIYVRCYRDTRLRSKVM